MNGNDLTYTLTEDHHIKSKSYIIILIILDNRLSYCTLAQLWDNFESLAYKKKLIMPTSENTLETTLDSIFCNLNSIILTEEQTNMLVKFFKLTN